MNEKIKDKDAEKAKEPKHDLEEGLEGTFPASDPVSATRPDDGSKDDKGKKPTR